MATRTIHLSEWGTAAIAACCYAGLLGRVVILALLIVLLLSS